VELQVLLGMGVRLQELRVGLLQMVQKEVLLQIHHLEVGMVVVAVAAGVDLVGQSYLGSCNKAVVDLGQRVGGKNSLELQKDTWSAGIGNKGRV